MKSNKGTTIIEIIIYIFLSVTIILVLTDIFSSLLNKNSESISLSEIETDTKFISQKLINQIALATTINIPINLNDTSSSLSFAANGVNYTYFLTGTNLFLNENGTINRLNGDGTTITNFSATRLGNTGGKPVIKINFQIKSTILEKGGQETKDYTLTIGTR